MGCSNSKQGEASVPLTSASEPARQPHSSPAAAYDGDTSAAQSVVSAAESSVGPVPRNLTDRTPITSNVAADLLLAAATKTAANGASGSAVGEVIREEEEEEEESSEPPRDPDEVGREMRALLVAALRGDTSDADGAMLVGGGSCDVGGENDDEGDTQSAGGGLWDRVVDLCDSCPASASYVDPDTGASALHLACAAVECAPATPSSPAQDGEGDGREEDDGGPCNVVEAVRSLIGACPESASREDRGGHIPLHYAIAPLQRPPPSDYNGNGDEKTEEGGRIAGGNTEEERWHDRAEVIRLLIAADLELSEEYLRRNDVVYGHEPLLRALAPPASYKRRARIAACSPLYAALLLLPDDFHPAPSSSGPTVQYLLAVHASSPRSMAPTPNASDGDSPLALLYRRFSRQFDRSEKFFPGDNSRAEVVGWRQRYKAAAMNTWRMVRGVLGRSEDDDDDDAAMKASLFNDDEGKAVESKSDEGGEKTKDEEDAHPVATDVTVHSAASLACPPDLLRYIVETNPDRVRERDSLGRLPLHVAAMAAGRSGAASSPSPAAAAASATVHGGASLPPFPAYHSKFVLDELLYAYPDAAAVPVISHPSSPDNNGKLPLRLAVESGASWIGGGVKSLYDAYPAAADGLDLSQYPAISAGIANVLSQDAEEDDESEAGGNTEDAANGSNKGEVDTDEHHDAVMLVQRRDAPLSDVVSAMWANEDDGAVQLLGCMSVERFAAEARLGLVCPVSGRRLDAKESSDSVGGSGGGDDQRERGQGGEPPSEALISVALQSLTSLVNAMKNHPNEPSIQESACRALAALAPADGWREISLAASGALASAVAAMQAHVSDAKVQSSACRALRESVSVGRMSGASAEGVAEGLGGDGGGGGGGGSDRATVVASVSGMTAVLNAMGAHPDEAEVQREAVGALEALTSHGTAGDAGGDGGRPGANLPELERGQAGPLLRASMHRFPEECGEDASSVLERLSPP